ncbi:MAG: chemotaxis protein CheA [Paracoccaceae bacterium]
MVNTSKILTVSYGTFSCTLEGFDDSFDTMKAIAEYFRDLASDDRYFGATPPTPDAEMLARIAEKEIERRVEARQDQGGIVLRASRAAAAAAPALAQPETPQQESGQQENVQAQEQPLAQEVSLTEEMSETQEVPSRDEAEVISATDADDLADRLTAAAQAEAEDEDAGEANISVEPEVEPEVEAEAEEIAAAAPEEAPLAEAPEQAPAPIAQRRHNLAKPMQATVAANVTPVPHPDADSVAAKLARIRSVVSRDTAETDTPDPIYTEDEHAEAFLDESADNEALDNRLDQDAAQDGMRAAVQSLDDEWEVAAKPEPETDAITDDFDEEDDIDAETLEAEVAAFEDAEAAETESFDAADFDPETFAMELDDTVEDAAEEDTSTPVANTPAQEDDADELDAILDRLIHRSPTKPVEMDADQDMQEEEADEILPEQDDVAAQDMPLAGPTPEPTPEQPAIRARVMKMKRADFEAAIEKGLLEEDEDAYEDQDYAGSDDLAEEDNTPLSAEAEAELARELAEVEAELGDLDDDEDDFDDADEMELDSGDKDEDDDFDEVASIFAEDDSDEDEDEQRPALRNRLREPGDEGDMTRLMAKASSEMNEPEGSNRRASIAHLRAAVAATNAEKDAGTLRRSEDQVKAYQDDLASVVRPRRLTAGDGASSRRPVAEQRPAPLKLVAEQRVDDVPVKTPAQPVRPRRVSMAAEPVETTTAPQSGAHSFAEFAEEMGAASLPELLEAAASYLSFVEGQEQFSRPQLMTKARQIQGEEFSREDGLRSFGMLLRQGKIEKLKGGRFTASDSIGYRPDARQAG